jgi:DNA-directed RNA polymerase subunit RPC12/RpoP
MADRECDAPVGAGPESLARELTGPNSPGGVRSHGPEPELPCPECGFPRLTVLTESDVATVLKCPRCGHLSAPVKNE